MGMNSHSKLAVLGAAIVVLAVTSGSSAAAADPDSNPARKPNPAFMASLLELGLEQPSRTGPLLPEKSTTPSHVAGTQKFRAPADAEAPSLNRDSYAVAIEPKVSYPVSWVPISSGFGHRRCEGGPCTTFHAGIDFASAEGAPVKSVAAGVVTFAGYDGNHGNKVIIDHNVNGEAFTTTYSHMQDWSVAVYAGQQIERGTHLGNVGHTGRSYGPHLHFELHVPGIGAVDPAAWFATHDTQPFPG